MLRTKKSADTYIYLHSEWWRSNFCSLERLTHSRTIYALCGQRYSPKKISHMLNQLRSMKKCYVKKNLTRWSVYLFIFSCAKLEFRLINLILMHKLMQHTPSHNVISFKSNRYNFFNIRNGISIYFFNLRLIQFCSNRIWLEIGSFE